jgi:hypothetical protein
MAYGFANSKPEFIRYILASVALLFILTTITVKRGIWDFLLDIFDLRNIRGSIPTVEVKCLPRLSQEKLQELHETLVNIMSSFSETGIKSERNQLNLFQSDLMEYGLGSDIKFVITDLPPACKKILGDLNVAIHNTMKIRFPGAMIYCSAKCCDPNAAYYSG